MKSDRKLWFVVFLAVAILIAASPNTFGGETSGVTAQLAGTSGNVAYMSVSNTTGSSMTGSVTVKTVVLGIPVSVVAPFVAPAGETVVVPVVLPSAPSKLSCGVIIDSGTPI